jgi:protease-4
VGKIYQSSVDFIYSEFLSRVSESRKQSVEEIHKIAQGRVWSGEEALNIGLVDKIGGLSDAVESAAELADLEENAYSAEFIVREIPMSDQILETLLNSSVSDRFLKNFSLLKLLSENQVWNSLKDLEDLNDPSGIFALSTLMFE